MGVPRQYLCRTLVRACQGNNAFVKQTLVALALLLHTLSAWAALLTAGQPQSFVFTDSGHFAEKPIAVFYYKSKNAGKDAKVLFSIHGADRSGKRARDNWIDFAEKHGAIVLAPEFDSARFPNALFQFGGMRDEDRARWTFGIIERLFERIRTQEQLTTPSYVLFGHSAGAQFVHRFVLLMADAKYSVAVAANAGSYTLPVYPSSMPELKFPWLLDQRLVDGAALKHVLGRRLVVLLGEDDIRTDSVRLPKSREAVAQGANRLQRGRNFYASAKSQAEKSGVPLAWQLVTVPGVGHNSRDMSKAAEKVLMEQAM